LMIYIELIAELYDYLIRDRAPSRKSCEKNRMLWFEVEERCLSYTLFLFEALKKKKGD
jgi:hypothetical protein